MQRRESLDVLAGLAIPAGITETAGASRDFEPNISRGRDCMNAACEIVMTPGPVAEMFAIRDDSEVRIKNYRADDTDEYSVQVEIYTGSSEPRLSLKQISSPEEAQDIVRRLDAAADVAAGNTERKR